MQSTKENPKNLTNLSALQKEIIESVRSGKSLLGKDGALTPLIKQALEAALEGEIEAHMTSNEEDNRRNGKMKKWVSGESGTFELETPRDRNGSFEPQIVKKRQTIITEELDNKILALYALGAGYKDISKHMADLYDYEVSPATITSVTDKLLPTITEWRNRPLEAIYTIVFLDAMFFKGRGENGRVVDKVLYNIMGINQEGYKDILGFYIAESEGSHFWLGVLNDLKARGIEDIIIACIDGLKGFPEAVQAVFPKTEIQLCVVHQIRNSIKYVASKDQKPFMVDLKKVYQASTKELAEQNLMKLDEQWGSRYPMVLKSWTTHWEHLTAYFKYSSDIRRLIYTTNPIEGFHRQVRKFTKTKGAFTSDNALFKLVYCACQKIQEKWSMPLRNWAMTVSQLDIYFPGRLKLPLK